MSGGADGPLRGALDQGPMAVPRQRPGSRRTLAQGPRKHAPSPEASVALAVWQPVEGVPENTTDRRQHPRVRVQGNAVVSSAGRMLGLVSIQDVSQAGALLAGKLGPPAIGQNIRVTVASGELVGATFQAEVRWGFVQGDSIKFGVRILPGQAATIERLRDFVRDELSRS